MSIVGHIGHDVLAPFEVSSASVFMLDLITELKEYSHTVFLHGSIDLIPEYVVDVLRSAGASVVLVDTSIVHYLTVLELEITEFLTYSKGCIRASPTFTLQRFPPSIRSLLNCHKVLTGNTVGLISTNYLNKFPCNTAISLSGSLPLDVQFLLSKHDKLQHPGVRTAVMSRLAQNANSVRYMNCVYGAGTTYISYCDIVIFDTAESYLETYSRTLIETMALGRVPICTNKEIYNRFVTHDETGIIVNNIDEIPEQVKRLRTDKQLLNKLGENARVASLQEDINGTLSQLRLYLTRKQG